MTAVDRHAAPADPHRAATFMARIIEDEIGVAVTPEQLVRLIGARWPRLSALAHAIHAGTSAPPREAS